MNSTVPLLILDRPCHDTLIWLENRLSGVGLRAVQTFDLQDARTALMGCACPHHGTAACDCQMVVVLVYDGANPPASLILHSNDGKTRLSLVDTPAQPADSTIRDAIQGAIRGNPHLEGL
jgi:hypothetical protein